MKRSKQQKLLRQWIAPYQPRQVSSDLRRLLLHYINFYPPETESLPDLSGTVTAVMVLIELLDEGEPGGVKGSGSRSRGLAKGF